MTSPASPRTHRRGADASRRRRRRARHASGYLVLLLFLSVLGTAYATVAPSGHAAVDEDTSFAVQEGRSLYETSCATCHGFNAQGTDSAPSLIGVGAAAVHFQMSTGRMPLASFGPQAQSKQTDFSETEIKQIAAYVASLAEGPEIPTVTEAELDGADLSVGAQLFKTNCASCHNFAGSGGALTYGKSAPPLAEATSVQVIEAMRTGPESMPVFADSQFDEEQATAIAKYVRFLNEESDSPGGHPIGRLGPVPEGLVTWVVGIGVLLLITLWIGARAHD